MGKMCCAGSDDDGGLDLKVILVLIMLAFLVMSICIPPRQSRVYAVYRCC
ncbi:hypothetical protein MANES_15G016750v8 [Manihot esculenta]|uniref:Uncharacterized protein n=1 Tax=Manihot esculenta TaxID=3983 RepID=A0ACB7GA33_MANES|nr:hypothetical protein MANES_15G016750v8 [Manihot esculenta]